MFGFAEKLQNKVLRGFKPIPDKTQTGPISNMPVLVFDGAEESIVYTYRGFVLDDMAPGDERYVEVLGSDLVIGDALTGNYVDTAENDYAAVAYDGVPFGTLSTGLAFLKKIAAKGYVVRVKVRMDGYYDAINGIPHLVAKTADSRLIRSWLKSHENDPVIPRFVESRAMEEVEKIEEESRYMRISERSGIKITSESKVAWMHPNEKTWLAGSLPKDSFDINPNFIMLETPSGSQAKPHVLVMDGSTPLLELSARNGAYATVVDNIGKPCKGRVVVGYYEETDDVRIIIRFD